MKELKPEMLELADQDPVEAAKLQRALEALKPAQVELPGAFNAALRERVLARQSELAAARKGTPWGGRRRFGPLLGYAAALAAGVFVGVMAVSNHPVVDPLGASVTWAEVEKAVQMVPYFHATFIADEPRNSAESNNRPSLYRIDWYYQQPGLCRAQGLGFVQFMNPQGSKMFSIKEGKWVTPKDAHLNFSIAELNQGIQMTQFLDLVLTRIFHGKPPVGEPVKNNELTDAGVEVFDYATTPGAEWARIWVMKASRMPLRMKVFQPAEDSSVLIEFDYSDPQPAAFFDAAGFEQGVRALGPTPSAAKVNALGTVPLAGKPVSAGQIHEAVGGYHAPTIRGARVNPAGDVVLVTSIPQNVDASGRRPMDEGYQTISDNWGNRYLSVTYEEGMRPDGDKKWYLMPIPPYKTGAGKHTLTVEYQIRISQNKLPSLVTEVMPVQTIELTDAGVAGQSEDWPVKGFAESKADKLRAFVQSTAPLAEQLAVVEAALAKDPDDVAALVWKLMLDRQYGREEQAWGLFEKSLCGRLLSDPALFFRRTSTTGHGHTLFIAQYMIYLAHNNRWSEFDALVPKVEKMRDEGLASGDRNLQAWAKSEFMREPAAGSRRSYASLIQEVLSLSATREAIQKNPPTLVKAFAAKDGLVCLQLRVPKQPWDWSPYGGTAGRRSGNGTTWSIDSGWFWDVQTLAPSWRVVGEMADIKTGKMWVALRPVQKEGEPTIKLGSTVKVIRDSYYSGHPENSVEHPWSVAAEVPKATIDSMAGWWEENTKGKNAYWSDYQPLSPEKVEIRPVQVWLKEAAELTKAKQFTEAAGRYRQIMEAPVESWPAYYARETTPANLLEMERLDVQTNLVQVLVEAGRLDEARREVEKMPSLLAAKVDLLSTADTYARRLVRHAQLVIVKTLIAGGKFTEAQTELDRIGKDRPDLSLLSEDMQDVNTSKGTWESVRFRDLHRDAWREFDQVWWDWHDAVKR